MNKNVSNRISDAIEQLIDLQIKASFLSSEHMDKIEPYLEDEEDLDDYAIFPGGDILRIALDLIGFPPHNVLEFDKEVFGKHARKDVQNKFSRAGLADNTFFRDNSPTKFANTKAYVQWLYVQLAAVQKTHPQFF